MMIDLGTVEMWFATGSQHLYGEETLKTVAVHAGEVATALTKSKSIPLTVVPKPVLTTPDAITKLCTEANASERCAGIIAWMHTFSPAKMWLGGLPLLAKPLLHLHTQFNRDLPWDSIDMNFMNLNQSAHGDREFGYIATRLGLNRKVVVGHWQDYEVQARIVAWSRTEAAWSDWHSQLEFWLPGNSLLQTFLSTFLNVSGGPAWIRTAGLADFAWGRHTKTLKSRSAHSRTW